VVWRRDDAGERVECAVVQFHDHAVQCRKRRRDFQQLQNDGLLGAEHLARGDAKRELIADLAGGAGNGDTNGIFHRMLTCEVQMETTLCGARL